MPKKVRTNKTKKTSRKTHKNKTNRKKRSHPTHICKTKYCKKVFLPEREKVEKEFSSDYKTIEELRKNGDEFDTRIADIIEDGYLRTCHDIYCQNKCKMKGKNTWAKSFTKKRKNRLMKQGATSGCRDLMREFPNYYKDKQV